jgi:hypothetical protein
LISTSLDQVTKKQKLILAVFLGYPDSEILEKTLSELDGRKGPRLDIIMTLTNRAFEFPQKRIY